MTTTTIKPGSTIRQVQCEIARLEQAFWREMLLEDNDEVTDRIIKQLIERRAFVERHMGHRNNARLALREQQ